jgi:phosphoribosyl 1,2-cyclic phosphodiesterase
MIKQLRASGGIWVSCQGSNILIDPGPGSIIRCAASKPKLDPTKLDAIILTHRHLDHSGDLNVMIEAMTEGGFKKRGIVFCPADALQEDPVILKYALNFPEAIVTLRPYENYAVGSFKFMTSMLHIHPVATFGLKFTINGTSISLLSDTRYFAELVNFYQSDILIIAVVFAEPRQNVDHLSLVDARQIISQTKPKKAILTHFGMTMLAAKPHLVAEKFTQELGTQVLAAYDGMRLEL